jgi:hypothetical protein
MLDFSNFPSNTKADIQVFNAGSSTWQKPRGKSMAYILCIGAGGAGGSGTIGANGTTAGGGGGGSGGQSTLLIPLSSLPDQLGVFVGYGGGSIFSGAIQTLPGGPTAVYVPNSATGIWVGTSGTTTMTVQSMVNGVVAIGQTFYANQTAGTTITGLGTGTGGAGTYTVGSFTATTSTQFFACPVNCVVLAASGGGLGGSGSGSTAGAAGVQAVVSQITLMPLAGLGLYNFLAGDPGLAGGSNSIASSKIIGSNGFLVTGGVGGGAMGTTAGSAGFAGGNITSSSGSIGIVNNTGIATAAGGTAGNAAPPGNGSNGFSYIGKLLYSIGGCGGGGAGTAATPTVASIGGNGGKGGIGSGGGGGGAGFTGTGGFGGSAGGNGGDGICIIISW